MSGHPSAAGRAQDRESTPAKDRRSTTEPTPPTSLSCTVHVHVYTRTSPTDILARKSARVGQKSADKSESWTGREEVGVRVGPVEFKLYSEPAHFVYLVRCENTVKSVAVIF